MIISTGKKSNSDLLEGEKLYIRRARIALPILVRQARAGETIYYSELAEEIGMLNPRNLNFVLGAIGNALEFLTKRENIDQIPLINCIVINKKDDLPGEGISWFIPKETFEKQPKNVKKKTIDYLLGQIYSYPEWYWVLEQFGLEPTLTDFNKRFPPTLRNSHKNFSSISGGESPDHLRFKNYIAQNPDLFGLSPNIVGQVEFEFPSMDTIDVLFDNGNEKVGIEVKSIISGIPDILRGLFQCVKYKALIEASQIVNDQIPNGRVVLALEGLFPISLIEIKNQLGIEVYEMKRV